MARPTGVQKSPDPVGPTGQFIETAVCSRWGLDPFTGLDSLDPAQRAYLVAFEIAWLRLGYR